MRAGIRYVAFLACLGTAWILFQHYIVHTQPLALHRSEFERSLGISTLGETFLFQLPADQQLRTIAKNLIECRKKEWNEHKQTNIPRVFHQVWPFEERLPDNFVRTSDLLMSQHPSFVYKLWNRKDCEPFLTEKFGEEWKRLPPYIVRDIAMGLILQHEGGIAVDLECECVSPINELMCLADCIIGFDPPLARPRFQRRLFISSALIASVPNHRLINLWLEKMMLRAHLFLEDGQIDPLFVTQESLTSCIEAVECTKENMLLLGPTYFSPINPSHIKRARMQWDGLLKRSCFEKILQKLHLDGSLPFSTIDQTSLFIHMHGGRQSRKCFENMKIPRNSSDTLLRRVSE